MITALFDGEQVVKTLAINQHGRVILEQTPFYAESGGQVGDKGTLSYGDTIFQVVDTKKMVLLK